EGVAAFGRAPAFSIKDLGDRGEVLASPMEIGSASDEVRISAQCFQACYRPRQLVQGPIPALPVTCDTNLLCAIDHLRRARASVEQSSGALPESWSRRTRVRVNRALSCGSRRVRSSLVLALASAGRARTLPPTALVRLRPLPRPARACAPQAGAQVQPHNTGDELV